MIGVLLIGRRKSEHFRTNTGQSVMIGSVTYSLFLTNVNIPQFVFCDVTYLNGASKLAKMATLLICTPEVFSSNNVCDTYCPEVSGDFLSISIHMLG